MSKCTSWLPSTPGKIGALLLLVVLVAPGEARSDSGAVGFSLLGALGIIQSTSRGFDSDVDFVLIPGLNVLELGERSRVSVEGLIGIRSAAHSGYFFDSSGNEESYAATYNRRLAGLGALLQVDIFSGLQALLGAGVTYSSIRVGFDLGAIDPPKDSTRVDLSATVGLGTGIPVGETARIVFEGRVNRWVGDSTLLVATGIRW